MGPHQEPLVLQFAEIAAQRRGRHAQLSAKHPGSDLAAVTQKREHLAHPVGALDRHRWRPPGTMVDTLSFTERFVAFHCAL